MFAVSDRAREIFRTVKDPPILKWKMILRTVSVNLHEIERIHTLWRDQRTVKNPGQM